MGRFSTFNDGGSSLVENVSTSDTEADTQAYLAQLRQNTPLEKKLEQAKKDLATSSRRLKKISDERKRCRRQQTQWSLDSEIERVQREVKQLTQRRDVLKQQVDGQKRLAAQDAKKKPKTDVKHRTAPKSKVSKRASVLV